MNDAAFKDAYGKLNPEQKKAVDTVEGPVMVIAGPGTGKTHILTLRIANILQKTDAKPDAVLVLTFTDSAARTVSRRLATFIGDDAARKVGAFTFHSFAEYVMKEYPAAFAEYSDRRLMGEVEQVLLWRDILGSREVKYVATPKSPYHYLNDLKSLEDDMTREQITVEAYRTWLGEREKDIQTDDSLRYKRGGKGGAAGELNPTGHSRLRGIEKGREAADLIEAYREEKDARGLYGYTDVLAIVVDALKNDDGLRADLQERYQYVLADEHQDANALQHALLDALAFDDHPNLFIVGDEKQAIFGFQGADSTHFRTFLTLYPKTEIIALTENYRSYQSVLNLSHTLLANLPAATGEHAQLTAARGNGGSMQLFVAPDALSELDGVATLIEVAIKEGTPPHEIAIIVEKNRTADLFALALRARGIPALRAGNIDLESRPLIRFILAFMYAAADNTDVAHLRESMLAPWWNDSLAERTRVLRITSDKELWNGMADNFPKMLSVLEDLAREQATVPPMSFFSHLLESSGIRAFLLSHPETVAEDIPLVRQLMMHIEELARRTPNSTFRELMEQFSKAREHDIGNIKSSITQREGQVTVITVHKAKGMEFEKVFVASLTSSEWESRGRSALIPSPFDSARDKEEIVRLFYVALTRAKNDLILSYPAGNAEGKETKPMSLLPMGLTTLDVPTDPLPRLHAAVDAPELVRELTLRYLTHDGLSPSAFNEYLESPPAFFAKRVLRLKEPETRAIAVGNAVHAAIAMYLRTAGESAEREEAAHKELGRSLGKSLLPRGDTFDAMAKHAAACLDSYLGSELLMREPTAIEEDFTVNRTVGTTEVKLKGKVDAVFKGDGGECIVDFKTASVIDKKDQAKFERQLAFYDLVLRANDHETTSALIIQVGEDEVVEHPVALTDDTRAALLTELDAVLAELIAGKWRKGEPSQYDDLLELFA